MYTEGVGAAAGEDVTRADEAGLMEGISALTLYIHLNDLGYERRKTVKVGNKNKKEGYGKKQK